MYCPRCGKEEPSTSTFCRGCGERLRVPQVAQATVVCRKCGSPMDSMELFCPRCGEPARKGALQKTSWAWWLLPILFHWVGGLGAYVAVRDRNSSKAKGLLILGFVMLALWIIIGVVVGVILSAMESGY